MRILIATIVAIACASAHAADRPNVLLICVDDLKPTLGCYGDALAKTPSVDRLAARGMVFERAYCNQAVCSPSRNALMLGLRPQTIGVYDLGTNFRKAVPDAVTLAQHFKASGYRTQAMGKIFHVGHGNREDAASWSVPHFQAKTVQYALPENKAKMTREGALFENKPGANELPKGAAYESADVPDDTYGDGKIAAEAIARLTTASKDGPGGPFFMAVGFLKPHLPFCAPKKYWDLYDRSKFELAKVTEPPAGAPPYAPQFGGELRNYADVPQGKQPLDPDLQRSLIHGYYAATSYMDAQLGRVLDALESTGLAKNTIVVLWGDHGWHLGDHGMWCKHTNYEQAARVPLLIAGPGVAGGRTTAFIETVDLYPTLAALAGLPEPKNLDGISHAPGLKSGKPAGRDSVTHVYPRSERIGRAVRTERYRLVEWKRPGEPAEKAELELYDYQTDPHETKNLAGEQSEVVAKLREILARQPEAKRQWRPADAPAAGAANPAKPKVDREDLFKRKDKDADGKLTKAEFMANQPDPDGAAQRWVTFDADKDGTLSKDEFVGAGKK
ncbi:MAG TPA: sulfatase-like hydrolase/transferase [Tepidisphaeraceae bacterium]|nr:sulfatase-like hydrolase/transferase [Tepidisphaeraceae bacterium]